MVFLIFLTVQLSRSDNPRNSIETKKSALQEAQISPFRVNNQLWGLSGVEIIRPILHQLLAPVEPQTGTSSERELSGWRVEPVVACCDGGLYYWSCGRADR